MGRTLLLIFEGAAAFIGLFIISALLYVCLPHVKERDIWDVLTAVGTVSAFFAAVGVASWEYSQRRQTERRKGEVILQTLLALAYQHWYLVRVATDSMNRPMAGGLVANYSENFDGYFSYIESAIQRISLHELPTPTDIPLLVLFTRTVRRAGSDISKVATAFNTLGSISYWDCAESSMMDVRNTAKTIIEEYKKSIILFGGIPHEEPFHLTSLGEDRLARHALETASLKKKKFLEEAPSGE